MRHSASPTIRLLAGLAVTLSAVAVYSGYTVYQLHSLRELQAQTIDRNRTDSLLLLRIQNNLNSLALAMRDMLDSNEPYPLTAWQPQFRRIKVDLEDALRREEKFSPLDRTASQGRYLNESFTQFWAALDRVFQLDEAEARTQVQLSLQARQQALSTAVARLLVQNNESEQEAAVRTRGLYSGVERNVYIFVAAMLILIVLTSLYLVQYNRRMFDRVASLSERRSELAQQLISLQENTFRSISRELHDEFGQILTAIGAMLQRTDKRAVREPFLADLREVREIVQSTLEKVRSLSHALHPVVLDEAGLESALDVYLPAFQRQTGINVQYRKTGTSRELDRGVSIQLYRVMQEALNNVARHSGSQRAAVNLNFEATAVVLEVADSGVGLSKAKYKAGMGLISMRERAELVNGKIEFLNAPDGGVIVRVTVPMASDPHIPDPRIPNTTHA